MKKEDRKKKGKREKKGEKGKGKAAGLRGPACGMQSPPCALAKDRSLGFLFYFADAGFEGLQGEVGLLFVDHERRREADGVGAGAEDEQAFVERQIDYGIAEGGGFFLGALVVDDFEADHQPPGADLADRYE